DLFQRSLFSFFLHGSTGPSAGLEMAFSWLSELNRHIEPCRRRAFVHDACTVQSLPANPAAAYRHHSAQLISAFGIGPTVRISHRTAELCRLGIRTVEASHSSLRFSCRPPGNKLHTTSYRRRIAPSPPCRPGT